MKLRRTLPLTIVPIAAVFALTGCFGSPSPAPAPASEAPSGAAEPTASASPTDTDSSGGAAASGDVAEPGTKAGVGEELVYEFTGTDDQKALIAAKLVDVTPATAEQVAFLNQQFDKDELKGFEISFIHVEMSKVSGDTIEFQSDYTSFKPSDAEGQRVQDVTLIGWDECTTESFTPEFDAGEPITQCYIAAAPAGGAAPAGVYYDGGYSDVNPYDYYDGKPLLFVQD
ncbi:hypothetical protein [Herbiconiux sp. YIM B11900]|uniref:hypothetical protein n=1 Tax=Herbiconiux sp. YIM B11900 TaxID=3404131 RepID=UPI003F8584AA